MIPVVKLDREEPLHREEHTMRWKTFVFIVVGLTLLTGCVSKEKYQTVLSQLTESQRTSTQTEGDLEALKQQAAAEKEAFTQEETRLVNEMLTAKQNEEQAQSELASARYHLGNEQEQRKQAEKRLTELSKNYQQLEQTVSHLRTERDALANNVNGLQARLDKTKETISDAEARIAGLKEGEVILRQERDQFENHSKDLQRQLDTTQQELASNRKASQDTNVRLSNFQQEKDNALAALDYFRDEANLLKASLAAEQAKVHALQDEKQQLLSGTTTAQEEIARLQKRAGELETISARVFELNQQLKERDQEIGSLQQAVGDRESLSAKLASKEDELIQTKERINSLTEELDALGQEAIQTKQERDQLNAKTLSMATALEQNKEETGLLNAQLQELGKQLKAEQLARADLVKEKAEREGNLQLLTQSKEDLSRSLKEQEAERTAKEAEIRHLTETHEKLKQSLESEIEKGDIRIKQVQDRLRINMIDQILFDSGEAEIKTAGIEVLHRVSDVLKNVTDKQIRIEGHTDTVPIGPKIVDRFPTNWELSTARATSVVRYLIDKGGLEKTHLAAVGYAYNRPVASNQTPDGREQNRRIEIVLYPKDLSEIASF